MDLRSVRWRPRIGFSHQFGHHQTIQAGIIECSDFLNDAFLFESVFRESDGITIVVERCSSVFTWWFVHIPALIEGGIHDFDVDMLVCESVEGSSKAID